MKQYNHQTKKWEEPTPFPKAKARDLCKGKKEHDFVLVIPFYLARHKIFTYEQVRKYYELERELEDFKKYRDEEYKKLGLQKGYHRFYDDYLTTEHYVCSVCGKEKIERN